MDQGAQLLHEADRSQQDGVSAGFGSVEMASEKEM